MFPKTHYAHRNPWVSNSLGTFWEHHLIHKLNITIVDRGAVGGALGTAGGGLAGGLFDKRKKDVSDEFKQISNLLKISNKELQLINRNLLAKRVPEGQDLFTALPESFFFRTRPFQTFGVQIQDFQVNISFSGNVSDTDAVRDSVIQAVQDALVGGLNLDGNRPIQGA